MAAILLVLFLSVIGVATSAAADRILVISGGTLVDGTDAPPVPDAVVVVRGDRVIAAGARQKVKVPPNTEETIDAKGKWIIPGLVDAHVHFFQSGGLYTRPDVIDLRDRVPYQQELANIRKRLSHTFERYLCSGVTAVVDVGGPMWNFEVREQAAKAGAAPRVAVAGPLISTYAPEKLKTSDPAIIRAESPEHARQLVRRQLPRKPDLIKVWFIVGRGSTVQQALSLLRAVVEESHRAGVRVAVHATELDSAKAAVRAGADVLVHSVFEEDVDDEFIHLVKDRKVVYTTTAVVLEGYSEVLSKQVKLTEFERQCGDPEVIATWDDVTEPREGRPADRVSTTLRNLKRMVDAGAIVAAGTDAGNIGTLHGPAIHREFELMAEAGLTPMQVLVAATRDAARVFSAKPQFGTILVGKLADLLLLDADPTQDVRNLRRIHRVIKGGQVFHPRQFKGSQGTLNSESDPRGTH